MGVLEREQPDVLSSRVVTGEATCSQAKVACGVFEPEEMGPRFRWLAVLGGAFYKVSLTISKRERNQRT